MKRITPWSLNAATIPTGRPTAPGTSSTRTRTRNDTTRRGKIFTIAADGSDSRQLTHFPDDTFVGSSSYSPDGSQILFSTAAPGGVADVFVMNADGSDPRPLVADSAWDSAPDWGTG